MLLISPLRLLGVVGNTGARKRRGQRCSTGANSRSQHRPEILHSRPRCKGRQRRIDGL